MQNPVAEKLAVGGRALSIVDTFLMSMHLLFCIIGVWALESV